MKIFFIGQKGIHAKFGGVETHVQEVAIRMAELGHEVFVYTRPNYTDKNIKSYKGVNLISLPSITSKHLDAISHTLFACLDLIRRKPDIIHFHSIGPSFLILLVKILKPKTKIIATYHTRDYFHDKWGVFARFCLKLGEYVICKFPDKTIVVSQSLYKYVESKYDIEPAYIPNGVRIQEKKEAEIIKKWGLDKDNYIITVSRLVGHKGIQYLIDAYNKINTDKKLVIVGDGAYTDNYVIELKDLASNNDKIIFTGNQTGETLKELFSNAYLFVQPSESEGLSIALLEAMSYDKACLISDIPENLEAVNGLGFTFKNKDANDLRIKLDYLLNNPEEVKKSGKLLKLRVKENYNWDNIVNKLEKEYSKNFSYLKSAKEHFSFTDKTQEK